jgi:hypothetical protein
MKSPDLLLPEDYVGSQRAVDAGLLAPRNVYLGVVIAVAILIAVLVVLSGRNDKPEATTAPTTVEGVSEAPSSTQAPSASTQAPSASTQTPSASTQAPSASVGSSSASAPLALPGNYPPLDGGITNITTNSDGTLTARPGQILTAPSAQFGTVKGWRWQKCVATNECTDIPDATKQIYTSPPTSEPLKIRAVVRVSLSGGATVDWWTETFTALPGDSTNGGHG